MGDFGKEHDQRAMHEVEIGGIIVKRCNYKRFWQNDKDLNRWKEGLSDNSRFDKLVFQVRSRWHNDFRADRAELTQQHNGLFRQRSENLDKPSGRGNEVQQLRD